jgi:6-phosphogluconolactonase
LRDLPHDNKHALNRNHSNNTKANDMNCLHLTVLAVLSLWITASLAAAADQAQTRSDQLRIYVGTYTSAASKGIYVGQLDLTTGGLRLDGVAAETKNPSFLAVHPNRRFVYAVGEISDFNGKRTGAVSAFRIVPATG